MKNYFKTLFLLISLFSNSCYSSSSSSLTSFKSISQTSYIELTYRDVEDKTILYSNIFGVERDSYYVYFFSRTCSHCNELKPYILKIAIDRDDIYFVESSEQVVFVEDIEQTIGLDNVEGFGILGYPTLIKIEEKKITKNIAGIPSIRNELSN